MPTGRFTLGRRQRLQGARAFARLRETGERRVCGCLIMNWRRLEPGARPRLGLVTSRRLGGAVIRSRARRLMREVYRTHQHQLAAPAELILVARASMVGKPLSTVTRDFLRCLREAGLWRDPQPKAPPCAS